MATDSPKLPVDFDRLWQFNKPAESESQFRELLIEARSSHPTDYDLQLLTQIARAQGLQRKFDAARVTLGEVESALPPQAGPAEVRYWLELGRIENSSGNLTEALPLFIKSFNLATTLGLENWAIDSAHMIAIVLPSKEEQLDWNLKAVALAEGSSDQKARGWLGSLYNNIGWTYHDSGDYEQALELFQRALAFWIEKGEMNSIRIAKWSVARAYRSMKKYSQALAIQTALEAEYAELSQSDGYVFEELAELNMLMGNQQTARSYFALALKELSKDEWFKANESKRLQRIAELAEQEGAAKFTP